MNKALHDSDPVAAGFRRAQEFRRRGERALLFNELLELREPCSGNLVTALRLADLLMSLGEKSAVHEYFLNNQNKIDSQDYTDLYLAWSAPTPQRQESRAAIFRLLERRYDSYDFCLKLSQAAAELCGPEAAATATRQALACARSGSEMERARFRMAHILSVLGQQKAALAEIRQLPVAQLARSKQARQFALLAFKCHDKPLGQAILSGMLALKPDDFDVTLDACTILAESGSMEEASRALNRLLQNAPKMSGLSREQYAAIIAAARPLGFRLEQDAITLAIQAYSDDEEFQTLHRATKQDHRSDFAASFPATDPEPASPLPGLLGRLQQLWRRRTRPEA